MISVKNFSFYFLLFSLFFGVIFYDIFNERFGFTYIDEICVLVLFFYWILRGGGGKAAEEFFFFLVVAFFYLIKSLIWPNNVRAAVLIDFIIEIKPFVAFYSAYNIGMRLTKTDRRILSYFVMLAALFILPFGLLGPGGGHSMLLLTGHARYATMAICLGITYLYCRGFSKRSLYIAGAIFAIGLLSTRSKMFGFYVLFMAIFFLSGRINYKKMITVKNVLFLSLLVCAVVIVSWAKVSFYFVGGISSGDVEHTFARPLLYMKMIEILKDYPIFGSGLGTYGTYASDIYYSPLYSDYGLIYNYEIGNGLFISDTFFPVFAQFGVFGILLFCMFWFKRIKQAHIRYVRYADIFLLKIVLLIFCFFMIESVADSTFTQNRGMYMMIMMAMFLKKGTWPRKIILK